MEKKEDKPELPKATGEKLLEIAEQVKQALEGSEQKSGDFKAKLGEGKKLAKETLAETRDKVLSGKTLATKAIKEASEKVKQETLKGTKAAAASLKEASGKIKGELGKGAAKTAETLTNSLGKLKEIAAEKREAWKRKAEERAELKRAKQEEAARLEEERKLEEERLEEERKREAARLEEERRREEERLEAERKLESERLEEERRLEAERLEAEQRKLDEEKREAERRAAEQEAERAVEPGQPQESVKKAESRKLQQPKPESPAAKPTGPAKTAAKKPEKGKEPKRRGIFGGLKKAVFGVAGVVVLVVYTVVVVGISGALGGACGQDESEAEEGYGREFSGAVVGQASEPSKGKSESFWKKHGGKIKTGAALTGAVASGFVLAKATDNRYKIEEEFGLLWACLYGNDYDGAVTWAEFEMFAGCCVEALKEIKDEFSSAKDFINSGKRVGASCR